MSSFRTGLVRSFAVFIVDESISSSALTAAFRLAENSIQKISVASTYLFAARVAFAAWKE
jgi:hypothetical protein